MVQERKLNMSVLSGKVEVAQPACNKLFGSNNPQKSSWMGRLCSIGKRCLTLSILGSIVFLQPEKIGTFRHSCSESSGLSQGAQSTPFYAKWLNDEQLAEAAEFEALYHEKAVATASNYSQYIRGLHAHGATKSQLMLCPSNRYAPKPLPLDGALRLEPEFFNKEINSPGSLITINEKGQVKPSLNRVAKRAEEIIQSWYPDEYNIQVENIYIMKGYRTKPSDSFEHQNFHTDRFNVASLSIPKSEYPIQEDTAWFTKEGDDVLIDSVQSQDVVLAADILTRNLTSYRIDELKGPLCHSKLTTPIIPGLIKTTQGVEEKGITASQFLQVDDCGPECQQQIPVHLPENSISIPYSETPYLFYGAGLVHAPAARQDEPEFEHLACSKNDQLAERMLLSFTYSVEIADPICSIDDEDIL